jgi:regulator of sigma E protease
MFLQNPIYFVVLLSVLIFAHELGHFLAAKALNVKVTRFSIGFGPRIFAFTRGETEYQVAWIPLGGYVKMAGDLGDESGEEDPTRGFLAQPPWKRAVIVGAGPLASLGFPFILYFVLFLGFPQAIDVSTNYPLRLSPRVMMLYPGMPAAEAGVRVGDLITSVDDAKVQTFDDLRRALQNKGGKETTLGLERDGQALQLKLVAAPSEQGDPDRKRGRLGVDPMPRVPLVGVPSGSAAERSGLHTFDRILSVDGQPVDNLASLEGRLGRAQGQVLHVEALRRSPAGLPGVEAVVPERVSADVPRQQGQGLAALGVELPDLYVGQVTSGSSAETAGLMLGDRLVSLDGQPVVSLVQLKNKLESLRKTPFHLVWLHQGKERSGELQQKPTDPKDLAGEKRLDYGGLMQPPFDTSADEHVVFDVARLGPGAALVAAGRKLGDTIANVAGNLAMLVTGQVPFSMLGGPIMLYGIASHSAQLGLGVFLSTMALISVNLGLLNLLPIPVLDGFGLLSAFWEWVRRRPIPMRAREIANIFGLAVLVLLMLFVFKNDIARLLM